MSVRYFSRRGNLFRKDGYDEERFDSGSDKWVNIRPAISDWLFHLDTETDEVDESVARLIAPTAFAPSGAGRENGEA